MIEVSCPSCAASYDVDESRIPKGGQRMRCPACGSSFQITADGEIGEPRSQRPPSARPSRKKTQVGLGPISVPPPPSFGAPSAIPPSGEAGTSDPATPFPRPSSFEPPDVPSEGDSALDLPRPMESALDLPRPMESEPELPRPMESEPDLPRLMHSDPDLPRSMEGALDLPRPMDDGVDLPRPMHSDPDLLRPIDEGVDLPRPLESRTDGDVDLPAPMYDSGVDLPAPKEPPGPLGEEIDLPMALTDAELPAPIDPDPDLLVPMSRKDLPVAREDYQDVDVEPLPHEHGGGLVNLEPDDRELDLEMDADTSSLRVPGPPALPSLGGPPSEEAIGEIGELELPETEDDLEFSELTEKEVADAAAEHVPGAVPVRPRRIARPPRKKRERPAWLVPVGIAVTVVALVIGLGFYLEDTKYGLFGIHLIEPLLPSSGDPAQVETSLAEVEALAATDSYAAARQSLSQLAGLQANASLNQELAARRITHEALFQLRFGDNPEGQRAIDELRAFLAARGNEAPGFHLAVAADALRTGDIATATAELDAARAESAGEELFAIVTGELALENEDAKQAIEAFSLAKERRPSARAQWGLSRAYELSGQEQDALEAAKEALRLSPHHGAARIAIARSHIARGEMDDAEALLKAQTGLEGGGAEGLSNAERSRALTMVAQIEEHRGRRGIARQTYENAASLDPGNADAALGAARLLLGEGAFQDALTRFQALVNSGIPESADPHPSGKPAQLVEAKLGAAEALLAMGDAAQAQGMIADLATPEPVDREVELWHGKVADRLGKSKDAVQRFRNAIKLDPKWFPAYVALSQHYASNGRSEEALAVLEQAQKHVRLTGEVRRLRGETELARNQLEAAVREYQAALEMEPLDSSALFGLSVAYRRLGRLDEAAASLLKVQETDANFPGLSLENGRLAEARGELDQAVASYQSALQARPDDIDLKSRLGAALVVAGELDRGEELLQQVLESEAYSAEAEHFLGRVEFARGKVNRARQHFLRAARLEPQNGLYRMYVGWAALEFNELATALRNFEAALERDPRLGDAYWLRARIRIRTGAVRDALNDLKKALALNPKRIDAYAAMAECYDQLGRPQEAIQAYKSAVEADPTRGRWWYRLGRIQFDDGKRAESIASLAKATQLGDAVADPKAWVAEAHLFLGEAHESNGDKAQAVSQYERYLQLAPPTAIDREDVQLKLQKLRGG